MVGGEVVVGCQLYGFSVEAFGSRDVGGRVCAGGVREPYGVCDGGVVLDRLDAAVLLHGLGRGLPDELPRLLWVEADG